MVILDKGSVKTNLKEMQQARKEFEEQIQTNVTVYKVINFEINMLCLSQTSAVKTFWEGWTKILGIF